MKIVSYVEGDNVSWGVLTKLGILDINISAKELGVHNIVFDSVKDVIRAGKSVLEDIDNVVETSERCGERAWYKNIENVSLTAPIPLPESIRDYGLFEKHILEMIRSVGLGKLSSFDRKLEKLLGGNSVAKILNKGWYQQPAFYKGNRFSVVGHEAPIRIPKICHQFDFELEFGVFLCGKAGNIKAEKARDHMFGLTLLNDFSARDIQFSEMKARMGPAKGKDFDSGYAMGPYIVTMDEVDDLNNLEFEAYVNGELFGGGNSADMHWSFEEVIEYTSRDETLYPGEFLGSGTISGEKGSGCGAEVGKYLRPGDVVELKSPALGTLRNTVFGSS